MQTVKLEKEIQRKIAKKLEQRIEKEVSENVEDGVLQKEVETAIENDIEKKVQKKLKQEVHVRTCTCTSLLLQSSPLYILLWHCMHVSISTSVMSLFYGRRVTSRTRSKCWRRTLRSSSISWRTVHGPHSSGC